MYAGALGDNAVERYAMFLTSLELSADIDERKLALTRAREHGLDMDRVAIVTAERTIDKAFEVKFRSFVETNQNNLFFSRCYL
jgi:nuclear pore complex protein Nup107